jgi:hypothetical protein
MSGQKTKTVVVLAVVVATVIFILWRRRKVSVTLPPAATDTAAGGIDGAITPPKTTETPVSGRWLPIQSFQPSGNDNYVHIAAIIPYDEHGNRIPVSSGSISRPYVGTTEPSKTEKLWDDSRDTFVHTDGSPGAFCEIDLIRNYNISRVDVWNRRDCCGGRIIGTKLIVVDQAQRIVASYAFTADKPEYKIKLVQTPTGSHEI